MAEPDANEAEKVKIATHFVLSSPPGQVKDVIADVRQLVPERVFSDAAMLGAVRQYNTEQLVFAKTPQGKNLIASQVNQADGSHFFDPATEMLYEFDHLKQQYLGESQGDSKLDEELVAYRSAIEQQMEKYVNDTYTDEKYGALVHMSNTGTVSILISAKNISLPNYWAGSWRSIYGIPVRQKGQVDLKGLIKVNVHYFEDGNVQLNSTYERKMKINVAAPDVTAKAIVDSIKSLETEFHHNLEDFYVAMHEHTFKAMRRFLPKTRQMFDWDSTVHKLAAEVGR